MRFSASYLEMLKYEYIIYQCIHFNISCIC